MRIVWAVYAALMLILCAVAPSVAAEVSFYVGGLPPYASVDKPGPPSGLAVDLMQYMMEEIGESFEPADIDVVNWARAVHEVEFSKGKALLLLARLPEREDRFKWVGPIDQIDIGVFSFKDSGIVINQPSDLLKYSIGVVRNTAPILLLLSILPETDVQLIQLSGIPTQLRMLREKRLDLIVQSTSATKKLMVSQEMREQDYPMIYNVGTLNLYFGFHKETDDAFIQKLQGALDRLKQRQEGAPSCYEVLRSKYIKD